MDCIQLNLMKKIMLIHNYTSDELQKIVTKSVVGMKGISFVPYTGMSVFAFRGDDEVMAEIVQVYQKNAN